MATVIDALVIQLGLDVTKFKREQKGVEEGLGKVRKRTKENTKSFEEQAGKAAQSFSKIKNELLSLLGIFMAGKGVKDFFTSITGSGLALTQMSKDMNMAASELDRWSKTVDTAGGDGQAFIGNLKSLNDQFKTFATTGDVGPALAVLRQMGVMGKMTFNADGTVNFGQSLHVIADALHAMPKSKADSVGKMLGFDTATVQLLEQGGDAVQKLYGQTKGLTDEQLAKEAEMALKLRRLGQEAKRVGETFMVRLAPAIEKVLGWLEKLAVYLDEHPGWFDAIAISAAALSTLITGSWLVGMLGSLAKAGVGVTILAGKFGMLKAAAVAAAGAAVGFGVFGGADWAAEKLGMQEKETDKNQDEENWQRMNVAEKVNSSIWRGVEKISDFFGATTLASNARADRINDETQWLKDHGRASILSDDAKRRLADPATQKALAEMRARDSATSSAPQTSAAASAYKPLLDLIGKAEGTDKGRGYNETLGYGAYTGGAVNLTGMTLREVDTLQSKMLANPSNTWHSSAVGRYQITQTTLRDLMGKLGLTGNELFDASMQDRLAAELINARGSTQNGLASIWASFPRSDTGVSAYGQRTGTSSAEVQRAMEQMRGLPQPGAQMAMGARGYTATSTTTNQSEVNINGPINIQTQATDAGGIARDMRLALQNNSLVNQANTGLA